jgi:hypothetical protein
MGKHRRGHVTASAFLLAIVAAMALTAMPALAAAPEAPSAVTVESVKSTEATFLGVLNPLKEGAPGTFELGTYEFLYKEGSGGCAGAAESPEPPGMSLGGGMEGVSTTVAGLQPGTEYTVCLLARGWEHRRRNTRPDGTLHDLGPIRGTAGKAARESDRDERSHAPRRPQPAQRTQTRTGQR